MALHLSNCVSEETRYPAVLVKWRRAGFGGPKRLPARDGRNLRRETLHDGVLAQETNRTAHSATTRGNLRKIMIEFSVSNRST